jgi:chaperonin GroES
MKLKPLKDRVLVKPLEEEAKTQGGIIIPDTAKEKPQRGRVVAVGPGKDLDNGQRLEMTLRPGDEVLFGKYSGTEIKMDEVKHLILREEDILGLIQ